MCRTPGAVPCRDGADVGTACVHSALPSRAAYVPASCLLQPLPTPCLLSLRAGVPSMLGRGATWSGSFQSFQKPGGFSQVVVCISSLGKRQQLAWVKKREQVTIHPVNGFFITKDNPFVRCLWSLGKRR